MLGSQEDSTSSTEGADFKVVVVFGGHEKGEIISSEN